MTEITINIKEINSIDDVFDNLKELQKLNVTLQAYSSLENSLNFVRYSYFEKDKSEDTQYIIDNLPKEVKQLLLKYSDDCRCCGYDCDFFENQSRALITELREFFES